jgi:phage FluMu protein Com
MEGQTIKCPFCPKLYVFMPYYAGDQSACPGCRERARQNMRAAQKDDAARAREIVDAHRKIGVW